MAGNLPQIGHSDAEDGLASAPGMSELGGLLALALAQGAGASPPDSQLGTAWPGATSPATSESNNRPRSTGGGGSDTPSALQCPSSEGKTNAGGTETAAPSSEDEAKRQVHRRHP